MGEPTTEAGRQLVGCVVDGEWRSDWWSGHEESLPEVIAAIETEARNAERDRITAMVETLPTTAMWGDPAADEPVSFDIDRAAVLAIVEDAE